MKVCPKCHSKNTTYEGVTIWSFKCHDCGYLEGGTASFPILEFDTEFESDYTATFTVTSLAQITELKTFVKEIANRPSPDLLKEYRDNESRISVDLLPMWKAREYVDIAHSKQIKATITPSN